MAQRGDTIGPYTLVQEVGHGSFGVVWLAESRTEIVTLRRALKLARNEGVDLEAFRREARIWVQVSGHTNVLPIIDAFVYEGQAVIVSEYAPDGSLKKWLRRHNGKAPSVEAAVEMALQILSGLEHLHGQRIVHRDIKPDNILLQCGIPRLADFGVACLINSDSLSRTPKGTPAYMAPEAFRNERNEQTDIWSVGVILYQMLAGRLPYEGSDYQAMCDAVNGSDPPPLPASVRESTYRVVERALRRDASQRYQSASEMRRELRAVSHEMSLLYLLTTLENEEPTVQTQPQPHEPRPHAVHSATPETRVADRPLSTTLLVLLVAVAIAVVLIAYFVPAPPVLAVSPNGKMLAVVRGDNVILKSQETEEKSCQLANSDSPSSITRLRFSPDGKILAGARRDNVILLWDDLEKCTRPRELKGHSSPIKYLAFWLESEQPDEQRLASLDSRTVILWKVKSNEKLKEFPVRDDASAVEFLDAVTLKLSMTNITSETLNIGP